MFKRAVVIDTTRPSISPLIKKERPLISPLISPLIKKERKMERSDWLLLIAAANEMDQWLMESFPTTAHTLSLPFQL